MPDGPRPTPRRRPIAGSIDAFSIARPSGAGFGMRRDLLAWLLCTLAACASSASRDTSSARDDDRGAAPLPFEKLAGETSTVRGASLLQDTEALIRWLRDHNRDVAAERSRVNQAQAELAQSELLPNPVLDLGWNGLNVGKRNPTGATWADSQNYTVGVQETIELGKRGPRIEASRLRLDAARHGYCGVLGQQPAAAPPPA